jgi:hypothetical protein
VMLNVVPIGFELWRQFNGFPPVIAPDEPALPKGDGAGDDDSSGSSIWSDEK